MLDLERSCVPDAMHPGILSCTAETPPRDLPESNGAPAGAFETRAGKAAWLTGAAA